MRTVHVEALGQLRDMRYFMESLKSLSSKSYHWEYKLLWSSLLGKRMKGRNAQVLVKTLHSADQARALVYFLVYIRA